MPRLHLHDPAPRRLRHPLLQRRRQRRVQRAHDVRLRDRHVRRHELHRCFEARPALVREAAGDASPYGFGDQRFAVAHGERGEDVEGALVVVLVT